MVVEVMTLKQKKKEIPGYEMYDGDGIITRKLGTDLSYQHEIVIKIVIIYVILHSCALYGFYLTITKAMGMTILWAVGLGVTSSQGITLGAHRGFTHNSFKMTIPSQIMFIIFQTISGQNHLYWWARDHRLHHKYCDTDADPYNARRGFFFSHIGWLMNRKHPLITEMGKTINMSDLKANKLIMFQRKYFLWMFVLFCIMIPTIVPVYTWNENIWNSFFVSFILRYVLVLNMTWCINSIAHMYGTREFDKRISARQSCYANIISLGEGWHNYHHCFPWDHAFSEFGYSGGFSTKFLYFLHKIGFVYDLKKASKNIVYRHSQRHGDGTLSIEFSSLNILNDYI